MSGDNIAKAGRLPSVDEVLRTGIAVAAIEAFGRPAMVEAVRNAIAEARGAGGGAEADHVAVAARASLAAQSMPGLRPVFNLTGTVLHTNLGRAVLAEAAIAAATAVMREATALEFDLATGSRGDRDDHVRGPLCALTGAEDATVVNNNAAAVLLVLNSLSKGREAIVSRGELIEIGGAFRMPDIMSRAGARLVEIGTTNRTHLKDYAHAIGPKTGLILKVHTSNYRIEGFTKAVAGRELAALAREKGVPLVNDLGSGTLIDLSRCGLSHEPTVAEAVAEGADIITFSGDKLLGGPQAGFIIGRKDLLQRINRNPMKRALRLDKIRLAALEATLNLYRDPDRLAARLPTVRLLARPQAEIQALAGRVATLVQDRLGGMFSVEVVACASQIGSGALPMETLPSAGIAMRLAASRGQGRALTALASAFRSLPMPVIGRISDAALILDLRCLENEAGFAANLADLHPAKVSDAKA